jgi:hypothetical protein
MLHSLPAVLKDLERCLIQGEDPLPIIGSIKWSEVIDWPSDLESALQMKRQVSGVSALVNGLNAPLHAALTGLSAYGPYGSSGAVSALKFVSSRLQEHV